MCCECGAKIGLLEICPSLVLTAKMLRPAVASGLHCEMLVARQEK